MFYNMYADENNSHAIAIVEEPRGISTTTDLSNDIVHRNLSAHAQIFPSDAIENLIPEMDLLNELAEE